MATLTDKDKHDIIAFLGYGDYDSNNMDYITNQIAGMTDAQTDDLLEVLTDIRRTRQAIRNVAHNYGARQLPQGIIYSAGEHRRMLQDDGKELVTRLAGLIDLSIRRNIFGGSLSGNVVRG